MTEPVFVLITANTCRHCIDFKNKHWNGVREYLDSKRIRYFDYAVPNMGERNALTVHHPKAPLHVRTKITFYPTLMLVDGTSWERAAANPNNDIPLLAEVYGAEMSPTGRYMPAGAAPITVDSVIQWIENCRNKATFASTSPPPLPTTQPPNNQQTVQAASRPPTQALNTPPAGAAGAASASPVSGAAKPAQAAAPAAPASSAPSSTAGQNAAANRMVLTTGANGQVQLSNSSANGQVPSIAPKHNAFVAPQEQNVCKFGYFSKRT